MTDSIWNTCFHCMLLHIYHPLTPTLDTESNTFCDRYNFVPNSIDSEMSLEFVQFLFLVHLFFFFFSFLLSLILNKLVSCFVCCEGNVDRCASPWIRRGRKMFRYFFIFFCFSFFCYFCSIFRHFVSMSNSTDRQNEFSRNIFFCLLSFILLDGLLSSNRFDANKVTMCQSDIFLKS